MEEKNAPPLRQGPSGRFARSAWPAFAVYTISLGTSFWLMSDLWSPVTTTDERAIMMVALVLVWAIGLTLTLTARQSASVGWTVCVWVLATASLALAVPSVVERAFGFNANERDAAWNLKRLASVEQEFKTYDRDENKVSDYWVGDVSTLYWLKVPGSGQPLMLIELRLAAADADPRKLPDGRRPLDEFAVPAPMGGYFYRAVRAYVDPTGKTASYDEGGGRNRERFGFCATASTRAAGRRTFIVDQRQEVYWKDTNGVPVEVFPADPLKEGWTRVP